MSSYIVGISVALLCNLNDAAQRILMWVNPYEFIRIKNKKKTISTLVRSRCTVLIHFRALLEHNNLIINDLSSYSLTTH